MGHTLEAGSKGQPVYNDTPQTVADLQASVDYAALVGTRRTGTTAQREAATGSVPDETEWFDSTLGWSFVKRAGAWVSQRRPVGGNASVDTDVDGFVTITHNFGTVANWVMVTPRAHESIDANSRMFRPVLWGLPTANTFRVRFLREDDNSWVSGAQQVRFSWVVGIN